MRFCKIIFVLAFLAVLAYGLPEQPTFYTTNVSIFGEPSHG